MNYELSIMNWGVGFGRELSVRPSVRVSELVELLSSRGSTELAERPKSRRTSEVSRRGPNGCGEVGKWG